MASLLVSTRLVSTLGSLESRLPFLGLQTDLSKPKKKNFHLCLSLILNSQKYYLLCILGSKNITLQSKVFMFGARRNLPPAPKISTVNKYYGQSFSPTHKPNYKHKMLCLRFPLTILTSQQNYFNLGAPYQLPEFIYIFFSRAKKNSTPPILPTFRLLVQDYFRLIT